MGDGMRLFRRRPSPSPVLRGNRFDPADPELELVRPPVRYLEVPMQHEGSASEVDSHRCSRGDLCASLEPKSLGWVLDESDDGPYRAGWEYPFVPAGADPLDTCLWVCEEDCACARLKTRRLRNVLGGGDDDCASGHPTLGRPDDHRRVPDPARGPRRGRPHHQPPGGRDMIPDLPMTFGQLAGLNGPRRFRVRKQPGGHLWHVFTPGSWMAIPFLSYADALMFVVRNVDLWDARERRYLAEAEWMP